MESIIDAFNYAMSEIIDLKSDGFSIDIIVPYDVKNGYWSLKKHTEYGIKHKREILPLEMWREIIFEVKNENEANQVREFQVNLIKRGIKFDTSVSIGNKIHFEFDWSFDYKKGTLDFEKIKLTDVVVDSAIKYGLIKKND